MSAAPEPRFPPVLFPAAAAMTLAIAWASWEGARLDRAQRQARAGEAHLLKVHEAMADAVFRTQLAAAVKTLGQDAVPIRTRLVGIGDKLGIRPEDLKQIEPVLPNLGVKEITVSLLLREVSMKRFLDYARTVEMEIPEAVVRDVTLTPVKDAGDRWEARLTVVKRVKLAP